MKKAILLTSILFSSVLITFSQEKEKVKSESNMEAFSSKTGTLNEISTSSIGTVGLSEIKTSVITNLITGDKVKGIRFEKASTKQYGSDAVNFLDEDEIDGLIKSIGILKTKVVNTTPDNYKEVRFRSRSGFEFGCFWSRKEKSWSYYYRIDKYNSDSSVWFKDGDIDKFETTIKEGQAKLKSL